MKEKNKFQTGNVIIVSLAHLLHDTYTSFLAPILPLLITKLNISIFQAGLLDVFRKLPSLANPFIGLIADKMSVRYFIIFAPVTTAAAMSLIGIAPHYIFLAILIFVSGISTSLFHVPTPTMVKHISGKRVGKGMSFYMLGGELARTLGPLIILGAVSIWGLEGTYKLIPFGVLASLILFIKLRKIEIRKDFDRTIKTNRRETFYRLYPFFINLAGITLFSAAMKSALTIYLPTYLTTKGDSLWMAGISLSILQFAGAGGTFFAGLISDKIGRKTSLLIISIISPVLMWLFIMLDGVFTIPILLISGFFLFGSTPVLLALVQETETRRPSLANGIYMTLSFGLSSVMTMLVGLSADKIGLDLTYKISAVVALCSIPFIIRLPSTKRKDDSTKSIN
ncbi:MAG: MFS transporter [Candidatus Cloacimonetes bacterium]|nr:MFS transporter [Candidatus Cloacimonadota bacterium]